MIKSKLGIAASLAAVVLVGVQPAFSQSSSTNQMIFQDEQQIQREDEAKESQLESEEAQYKAQAANRDDKADAYRSYAQKRIAELEKMKNSGGSPVKSMGSQVQVLQAWISKDDQTRTQEKQQIQNIDRMIANLRAQEQAATQNMQANIQDMLANNESAAEDRKFNQMMQINNFNERQSEMGAVSWGRPPQDGSFGGYGLNGWGGGYGGGYGGYGRRW